MADRAVALISIGSWVDAQAGLVVYVLALFNFGIVKNEYGLKGAEILAH